MESTNQRYATFLRQWKKRHNYNHFRNEYRKYEHLPRIKGRKDQHCHIGSYHEKVENRALHGITKLQPLPQSVTLKPGKLSAASSVSSKLAELPHGNTEVSDFSNIPSGLSNYRETKGQKINLYRDAETEALINHKRNIAIPPIDEVHTVKNKPSTVSDPVLSSAELADLEFWLLFGESAQSTASHFSYALLARIDQMSEVPIGNGRKSRTVKTNIHHKVFPTGQRDIIQSKLNHERSCRPPETRTIFNRQSNSMKPKRNENCVYWNHNSDCADRYRLHILKYMKKTNNSLSSGQKITTVDELPRTSCDKSFENSMPKYAPVDLDDNNKSPSDETGGICFNSKDITLQKVKNGGTSPFGDGRDCTSQKEFKRVAKKTSDLLQTSKVHLNTSKNNSDKKSVNQMVSAASVVALASSASTKPGHEQPDSQACLPSAGSSVTVYLPRCPLESGTGSNASVGGDAGLQKVGYGQERAGSNGKSKQRNDVEHCNDTRFRRETKL
ncbi:hypothetical protein EGW08_012029 [Elysia chlorotica]|uniref:Uncharacterized protein n=1 Tax=Elysia chlorotica TaxID=188477 RepID=A0A3S1B582_ELYCH|nr:hypothetical protein EGW08_012029 [Elysia chlorotica]